MQSEAGTLLVQTGLISEGQLQQGLAAALRASCTLVQALVRLGLVQADELAARLSTLLGVPLAAAEQFENLPAFITKLVTAEVVMTHRAVPIMLHRGVLHLAMSDPTNRSALEEISFLTGYSVSPVAASERHVEAAMDRYYGIPPDESIPEMRLLPDLGTRVGPEFTEKLTDDAPQVAGPDRVDDDPGVRWEPPAAAGADVELEELFFGTRADQQVITLTRPKRTGTATGADAARNLGEALQAEVLRALDRSQTGGSSWDARPVEPSPAPAEPPGEAPAGPREEPAQPVPAARALPGEPTESDPDLAPLPDSQEARVLIQQAPDRDDIARVLVRYARTFVARAVLMIIKKDLLVGWMGAGEGLTNLRVKGIMIPLDSASVFRTARQTATDYFGSMPRGVTNDIFLTSLGAARPRQVLLIPISVRHKPICILYGDCASAAGFAADLSPLHLMAQEAAQAFEKLILDRKIGRLVTR